MQSVEAVRVTGQSERFWEDLAEGSLLRGPGITISEAHLVNWAGLTGDWVSLHLDEQYAAGTRFGQRIAHGPLTLSLALGLMTQTGYFGNVVAWLGLDDVRATAPVHIGDTVRPEAEVAATRRSSSSSQGIWTLAYRVVNQNSDVVMTFRSSFMIRCR
ncbi:MaoC/PaaZ C-terminal domain-containing protein [Saccharopolyspora erythraea]|uniref:MaoC/PaaZ C-terminal domain-containing protein n=1 Tax=Saccharopolyspora erythraea TaxID=1836 RepID=UPI0020117E5F|nr:MaoC/PaaZ C-terminal domain-containing protein [Saccharopolyspora erythraea]